MTEFIQLAKEEHHGTSISIAVETREGGGIALSGQDIGDAPKRSFGSDSYEYWVRIPSDALPRLAVELLLERYAGRINAVSEFRDFCEKRGIGHEFESWP